MLFTFFIGMKGRPTFAKIKKIRSERDKQSVKEKKLSMGCKLKSNPAILKHANRLQCYNANQSIFSQEITIS